jgi:hypothetical protein
MSTTTTPVTLTTYLAQAAVLAKVAKKAAADAYGRAEADAIAAMTVDGITSVELPDDTLVTVVRPERVAVDVEALAAVLPASVLERVTTVVRVVDAEALAEAVKVGLVAPSAVEAATTRGEAKPTLRITARPKRPSAVG